MTAISPIDRASWDASVSPADDFYAHVNGAWLREHPVPPEYGAYGAFHEVNRRNQDLLHELLHEAADHPGEDGSVRHKVGDYFMAGMMMNAADQHLPPQRQPLLPALTRKR